MADRAMLGVLEVARSVLAELDLETVLERVLQAAQELTGAEYAALMSKEFGEEVEYRPMSLDVVRAFDHPAADDLANMFHFFAEFQDVFAGVRVPDFVRRLNPQLRDFATWLARNRDKFTL